MKKYSEWEAETSPYDNVNIGPQAHINARVTSAGNQFDKRAGSAIDNMTVNQKLHYLADTLMGMTGNDTESVKQDRQLLTKLRTVIIKIDNALKNQQ